MTVLLNQQTAISVAHVVGDSVTDVVCPLHHVIIDGTFGACRRKTRGQKALLRRKPEITLEG